MTKAHSEYVRKMKTKIYMNKAESVIEFKKSVYDFEPEYTYSVSYTVPYEVERVGRIVYDPNEKKEQSETTFLDIFYKYYKEGKEEEVPSWDDFLKYGKLTKDSE